MDFRESRKILEIPESLEICEVPQKNNRESAGIFRLLDSYILSIMVIVGFKEPQE